MSDWYCELHQKALCPKCHLAFTEDELNEVENKLSACLQLLRELDEEMGRGMRDMDVLWDRIKEILGNDKQE